MARLIDADSLIEWLTKPTGFRTNCEDCCEKHCIDCVIDEAIKNEPTVDAVEVVRCKDCATYKKYGWCEFFNEPAEDDNFCSQGEKRGEKNNG